MLWTAVGTSRRHVTDSLPASLETARRDSRLGYECEMGYVYSPYTISEKLRVLHETLEQQIPAYREQHGLP